MIFFKGVFSFLALLFAMAVHANSATIYYFLPDSPVSNLAQLKADMEDMFAKSHLQVTFQPFARLGDFNRQIKDNPPMLLIGPAWYAEGRQELQVMLRAYRQGKSVARKLLITKSPMNAELQSLAGKTVAITAMGQKLKSLKNLFDSALNLRFDQSNIIEVVKDVDAIFAVALKQVDMALVAKTTVAKLNLINPRIIDSIQIVAESKPLPLPILMRLVGQASEQEVLILKNFMKSLKDNKQNTFRRLLMIDEWREIK